MTMQFEDETIFEAPFSHEGSPFGETAYESGPLLGAPELLGETAPGTHETGFEVLGETMGYESGPYEAGPYESGAYETGAYESGPYESAYETGPYESAYETGPYESAYESGPYESAWESAPYESVYESGPYESAYESGPYESAWESGAYESAWESGPYETGAYEQEGLFGNLLSGALGALGLGEEELVGESSFEWTGEVGLESDQFLGRKVFKALRNVVGRVLPMAKRLLPGALTALGSLVPGGALLSGPAGQLLGRMLKEGEGEIADHEAQMFGSGEALGEVAGDERAHEAALTEIMANEAVVAESEDEAASILATTLPITITIMGGRRALRPVIPAYAQAQRRLVSSLRSDPQSRQLLRAVPSIDRRAVHLLRRWQQMRRPITGPVAVNALAAATRDVLGDPRRLRSVLLRNGAIRLRTAPLGVRRVDVYRPRPAGAASAPWRAPTAVRRPYVPSAAARRGY